MGVHCLRIILLTCVVLGWLLETRVFFTVYCSLACALPGQTKKGKRNCACPGLLQRTTTSWVCAVFALSLKQLAHGRAWVCSDSVGLSRLVKLSS
jgi:hypothetical protein